MFSRKRFYYCTGNGRLLQAGMPAMIAGGAVLASVFALFAFLGFQTCRNAIVSPDRSAAHSPRRIEERIDKLETEIDRLSASDDRLRLAVNLPVTPEEEILLGTGGNRASIKNSGSTAALLAETERKIELLTQKIDEQKKSHEKIRNTWKANQAYFAAVPALKPVNSPVSSGFGFRVHPVYKRRLHHDGIDFSTPSGSKIHAPGNGIVRYSGYDGGYGRKVVIDHGYGYATVYAHLSESLVSKGQRIVRGEVIALSGNTGISTGPHLHYEVLKNNRKVDPTAYFFDSFTPESYLTAKPAPVESDSNS
ncbi:hypothetical protein CHL67_09215 [Prosthecochloris sp. GSB1]|uniref:M23 family metallopeptidase n=1 Tax=Prosthecochloris sp. GSB1 TaxID=281093 RepID=UPI000B8CB761|nr:M23 family metallopeptidase [Prosthecochloris sp. GSB1]ASQ91071.1 hypothetical protein CHL67_09215 [Prosthecochloris sp. GSB1]